MSFELTENLVNAIFLSWIVLLTGTTITMLYLLLKIYFSYTKYIYIGEPNIMILLSEIIVLSITVITSLIIILLVMIRMIKGNQK